MQPTAVDLIMQLLPAIILTSPLVVGAFYLAPKMKGNAWIWAILFLIPMVNLFAAQIFLIRTAGIILNRLNAVAPATADGKFN